MHLLRFFRISGVFFDIYLNVSHRFPGMCSHAPRRGCVVSHRISPMFPSNRPIHLLSCLMRPILGLLVAVTILTVGCADKSDVHEEDLVKIPFGGIWEFTFGANYYESPSDQNTPLIYTIGQQIQFEFGNGNLLDILDLQTGQYLDGEYIYTYWGSGYADTSDRRFYFDYRQTDPPPISTFRGDWLLRFSIVDSFEAYQYGDITIPFGSGRKLP